MSKRPGRSSARTLRMKESRRVGGRGVASSCGARRNDTLGGGSALMNWRVLSPHSPDNSRKVVESTWVVQCPLAPLKAKVGRRRRHTHMGDGFVRAAHRALESLGPRGRHGKQQLVIFPALQREERTLSRI